MKYWGRNSNCCIVQPGQCVLPAVSSLSGNYPSLSLSLPPSAKHNLLLDRDNCFRDQHFPNRDAGKRYCAIATLGCWVRAGSRTRAAEMILAGGQSTIRSDRAEIPIQAVQSQAFTTAVPSKSGCCPPLSKHSIFTLLLATSRIQPALHFPWNPVTLPRRAVLPTSTAPEHKTCNSK